MNELGGVIRALLAFAGGYVVAKGYFTDADWNALSGAIITAIPIVWSVWQKRQQKAAVQSALMTAPPKQPASNADSGT